ncbi:type 4a pilus biogenesis protein PilO [Legionella jamestowniensis]|uniref:Tfp pilus assembly protein PilO n=1 Tax=Legionella jamestowniensis TaxID=455 RepID=A0A0W0UGY0_9GAMM|nr:type 4a pilus biogenesis protein PilO [Legionella jamestowniensis]KTD07150.1 Tfp pilus assembly protein PilO [Legionella jamestowniensis]OCH98899.1 hypothetical protein A8135_09050 [Legionella jamestowniensis]SFL71625.1 type IV pilus assembly protein PilO [Legionella jamestowniensis DSM 19215]
MVLSKKYKEVTVQVFAEWIILNKYLITMLVVILMFGINYFLFISEAKKQYYALKAQEIKLKAEFEKKQSVVATIDNYKKQREKLNTTLNKIFKLFSDKKDISFLPQEIFNLAKSNQLIVNFFAPVREIKHNSYIELPIHLMISGHYRQLAIFLSKVTQLPYLITFGDFKITKIPVDKIQKSSGQLLMKVTLKLYRLPVK